jgi:hypothetical protein
MERLYCTVDELLADLESEGVRNYSMSRILDKVQSASAWIEKKIGQFIPTTETRTYDGSGENELYIGPLLSLTELQHDGTVISESELLFYPLDRLWKNGPYIRVAVDPDSTVLGTFLQKRAVLQISGQWGLYSATKSTGATVASQDDSSTSLVVDDGSLVSVAAVLLIGSEQELVDGIGAPTDSTAALDGEITSEDEIITLDDATQISAGEVIRIGFEQMKALDISGNDVLVVRGWNRTKRITHATATAVYVYRTFTVQRGVNGTTAAEHTDAAISRYVAPDDIRWLCKQIAGLMLKKADSGFSGKAGNADTGETFYYNEFPKGTIENIEAAYVLPYL